MPAPSPSPGAPSDWPLVGRDAELAFIEEALGSGGTGIVLAGEAGVGKSRLASEALNVAGGAGARVERVRATRSAAATSLGPFAHLLRRSTPLPTDRLDLLLHAAQAVRAGAEGRPVVLGVDDAHLLDDTSAALVEHLLHERMAALVLTIRSGEPMPDAVTALWKDDDLPRLEIQALARPELEELLTAALDGPVAGETVDALWETSGGNPLLLREVVLDAQGQGTLEVVEGLWTWSGEVGPGSRLKEIVDSRLGHLDPADRRLLEILAVAEPLGVDLLAAVAGEASIGAAERRGHVQVETADHGTEARLAHPLHGEVLLAHLPTTDHREICTALARAITDRGRIGPAEAEHLARWHVAGITASPGAEVLARAASEAAYRADYAEAEARARRAVAERADADGYFALGLALIGQSREAEADAALDEAARLAATDEERARVAVERLRPHHVEVGRADDVMGAIEATEVEIEDEGWRLFVQAHRAGCYLFMRRPDELLALTDGLLAPGVDERVRVRAFGAAGPIMAISGRVDETLALAEQLLPPALQLHTELPRAPMWVTIGRSAALLLAGRLDDIDAFVNALVAMPLAAGRGPQTALRLIRGRTALLRGEADRARRDLLEATAAFREPRDFERALLGWSLSLVAEAAALAGDLDAAQGAADEAVTVPGLEGAFYEGDARRARAWVLACGGELTAAVDELLASAEDLAASGFHGIELWNLHDALRLGAGAAAAERVEELAEMVGGAWAPAAARYARGVRRSDPETLADAADALERIGARLPAADALAAAERLFAEAGLRARATEAARRAARLRAEAGGVRSPGQAVESAPVALTRREREVVALAAQGLSNRDIADRLVVSVRTVEGHLYRASTKLGVSDRGDLAGALGTENA